MYSEEETPEIKTRNKYSAREIQRGSVGKKRDRESGKEKTIQVV